MSITPRGVSVQEAYRWYREDKLIVNRKYQRKLVWTIQEKVNLIDSLLRDYPIPLILLAEVSSESGSVQFEIMDGMQRLNAIFSYIENQFAVDEGYFDIRESTRAQQLAKSGLFDAIDSESNKLLSPEQCAQFLDYQLALTSFPIVNERQVTEIFGRINSGGKQLSAQEKRQAGMVDDFSMLIRKLASEIRGDSSAEKLVLSGMPEISINSTRADLGYMLKAEDIFWCRQGILSVKQLRDSEDEEMLADICTSIIQSEPIARSKELFDSIYDEQDPEYQKTRRAFNSYGSERLLEEIKVTFSVLNEVIAGYSHDPRALVNIVSPGSRNPIKGAFFAIFMAFHKLVISEERSPDDYKKIMSALKGLQSKMVQGAKYSTTSDRTANVDVTYGLIQKHFIKKDPPMLRHGAGLALDMENALRRSRIESPRYECKQGFIDLSEDRRFDHGLLDKVIETICGIANVGPDADGFIFIGVADKKADADKIALLDDVEFIKVSDKYVVGLGREMAILGISDEQYLNKFLESVRKSELTSPLKENILTQTDYVEYKGMSILRIHIPAQKTISFVGENSFVREGASTIKLTPKKLIAVNNLFK